MTSYSYSTLHGVSSTFSSHRSLHGNILNIYMKLTIKQKLQQRVVTTSLNSKHLKNVKAFVLKTERKQRVYKKTFIEEPIQSLQCELSARKYGGESEDERHFQRLRNCKGHGFVLSAVQATTWHFENPQTISRREDLRLSGIQPPQFTCKHHILKDNIYMKLTIER